MLDFCEVSDDFIGVLVDVGYYVFGGLIWFLGFVFVVFFGGFKEIWLICRGCFVCFFVILILLLMLGLLKIFLMMVLVCLVI